MLALTSWASAPVMTPARRVGCDVCFKMRVSRVTNPGRQDYLSLLPTHGALFFLVWKKETLQLWLRILKRIGYSRLSGWAQHNHQGSRREAGVWEPGRENADAVLLALKMMQRATRWAMQVASRSWRREGNGGKGIVPLYWSPVAAVTEYHRLVA